jgi:4-amino-4-deoxy-L-arabinose transferase-like glycosyltransferase
MTRSPRVAGLSRRIALPAILLLSLVLNCCQLSWGLPNGNSSWAADALGPLTVLSIVRRSLLSWDSGWFYFKYPLGYPLLLAVSYLPYLAALAVTGQLRHPSQTYPYGFSHPESALYVMALLGRLVSVACAVGTVALTYWIGRRLFDRATGLLGAWFVATAYPIVYYAHTSNLDAAYLFWLVLALWGAVLATESDRRWPYVICGIAAAMAVSTKEQGFAFLLPLPLLIAAYRVRAVQGQLGSWQRWRQVVWNGATRAGIAAMLITVALVNNALANPHGFANRLRYLSGRPVSGITARLAPVEFGVFKGLPKEWLYVRQLTDALESSLGLPLLLLAVAGVLYVVSRRRRAAAYLLIPAAVQYYLSLRTLDLIRLRYTLPLIVIGGLCAAALCVSAARRWRVGAVAVAIVCVFGLARAVEFDLLLQRDSRYQAERWLKSHATAASTVETYQKAAYVPRLSEFDHREVPLQERTLYGIQQRHPDFIVISSAAKKGITHRWNPDWRQGHTLLVPGPGASAFIEALESERLPYRRAASFEQRPILLRLRITSLCPEISIFQRVPP